MIVVVPAVALLGVAAAVIISTRVKTFMEAYQASGILVIAIIFLMVAQATGSPVPFTARVCHRGSGFLCHRCMPDRDRDTNVFPERTDREDLSSLF
ncbi:MAG: hypothetical protein MZV65_31300 [Chromatiales bacterium]|nr:hypothetical protein [Chromatiales bacterium]